MYKKKMSKSEISCPYKLKSKHPASHIWEWQCELNEGLRMCSRDALIWDGVASVYLCVIVHAFHWSATIFHYVVYVLIPEAIECHIKTKPEAEN